MRETWVSFETDERDVEEGDESSYHGDESKPYCPVVVWLECTNSRVAERVCLALSCRNFDLGINQPPFEREIFWVIIYWNKSH